VLIVHRLCLFGLARVLTAYLYQCDQMKRKCPLDCMPVVHPNTKARSEFIPDSLFASILLAVVVCLVLYCIVAICQCMAVPTDPW